MGTDGSKEDSRPRGTARGAAVRLLARKDQSSAELREKLLKKGFEEPEVDEALGSLAASGFLNDARWTEGFVRRQMEAGRGWSWIRAKLAMLRVTAPPAVSPAEEARQLLALLRRRGVDPATLTDLREKAKIVRFLRGRGYRSAAISMVLGPGASDLPIDEVE